VPLCADSKLYYERYRAYSLIDGELVSTAEADDSSAIDQQTSDAEQQLMLTEDSKSNVLSFPCEDCSKSLVVLGCGIFVSNRLKSL